MIDLQKFCAVHDPRNWLEKPFTEGDFTYATNGHILVRVPRLDGYPDVHEKMRETCLKVFATNPQGSLVPGLPADPAVKMIKCDVCAGSGEVCDGCGGWNNIKRGHEVDCDECDGTGEVESWGSNFVAVGCAHVEPRYLRLVKGLPNVMVYVNGEEKALYFTFDGGDGLLMPRRKK